MEKIIQRAIAQLFLDQAHTILRQPQNHYLGLTLMAYRPEDCRNVDIESLETMTEISTSTLKRFFKLSYQLNEQNKQKMLHFMGVPDWESLRLSALQYIESKVIS